MLNWQKRARAGVAVVAIGVAAAVFLTTRRREEPPPPPPVVRVDPAAVVESSGAVLTQMKGERETVTIRADRQLSYPDGSTRLLNATVTSIRQGKTFVVKGDTASIGANQANIEMQGHVRMTSSDGLEVTAERSLYNQSEGIVRSPGPVSFVRGRMSGSGVDFSYDENRDLIGLSDRTKVRIAADGAGAEATDIASGAAVLARKDQFVSFERAVRIVRGGQVIDADSALGDMTENQEHLKGLELQGSARIDTPKARAGELRQMAGDLITLVYYDNSDMLQNAIVAGDSSLRIAGDSGAPERVLRAQNIEIGMAPDGATVMSLNARDHTVLDLPGAKGQPSKNVAANALVASGTATGGLTAARFSEGVQYRETGGKPAVKRVVTSQTLDTALNGGLGEIREAQFTGGVRLRDDNGGTGATAAHMRYQVETGQVELTGAPGELVVRVVNDEIAVDASRVEMTIDGGTLKASGGPAGVRTVMQPAKSGAKEMRRTPGIMQPDRPVNGSSRQLVYSGGAGSTAEFTGGVRLWQGEKAETVIQGEKIALDGTSGNLTAEGSVISVMMVQDTNPTTNEREARRSTGQGQQMVYDEGSRTLTYSKKARLVGPQGDLTGETIILTLGANGQDIERLEALDGVTLKEADRVTIGDHLTYVASAAEYRMAGKGRLVRMLRTTPEGCRRSEGNILTFSRTTDSLHIEGREETRTLTSSDASCLPPKS